MDLIVFLVIIGAFVGASAGPQMTGGPAPGIAPLSLAPDPIEGADNFTAPLREPETQIATGRYTTALEVKPILNVTRPQWLAIQASETADNLYFTNLLAWRCGLWDVRYGLNGAPPEIALPLEPCHDDTASPNAMVEMDSFPPYITAPAGSIDSVEIAITYDDGTTDAAVFARRSILMP